jgi:hypothetical protein
LPAEARSADRPAVVRVASRDRALVLCREGLGSLRRLDARGRLTLPGWLRRLVGSGASVLVAASVPDALTVVVTDRVRPRCRGRPPGGGCPMTRLPPNGTDRFTMGLILDVARVLEAHGYGSFDGRQDVELQQHLLH